MKKKNIPGARDVSRDPSFAPIVWALKRLVAKNGRGGVEEG